MRARVLAAFFAAALLGGCHLLSPYDPRSDAGLADAEPVDGRGDDASTDLPQGEDKGPDEGLDVGPAPDTGEDIGPVKKDVLPTATWTKRTIFPSGWKITGVTGIWGTSPSDIYLTGSGGVLRSADQPSFFTGIAWHPAKSGTMRAVGGAGGEVVAVGDVGQVMIKSQNFAVKVAESSFNYLGVTCTGAKDCFFVGHTNMPAKTAILVKWDGIAVKYLSTIKPPPPYYSAVWTDGKGFVAVGGPGCVIAHRATKTGPWIKAGKLGACTADITGIWGKDASKVHAVGSMGQLYRYTSGTKDWHMAAQKPPGLNAVWGAEKHCVFAVGEQGKVRFYSGNWNTVSFSTTGTTKDLVGVWGVGCGHVYAVTEDFTVLRFN